MAWDMIVEMADIISMDKETQKIYGIRYIHMQSES